MYVGQTLQGLLTYLLTYLPTYIEVNDEKRPSWRNTWARYKWLSVLNCANRMSFWLTDWVSTNFAPGLPTPRAETIVSKMSYDFKSIWAHNRHCPEQQLSSTNVTNKRKRSPFESIFYAIKTAAIKLKHTSTRPQPKSFCVEYIIHSINKDLKSRAVLSTCRTR